MHELSVLNVACPDCHAQPGKPCTSKGGPKRDAHKERQRQFERKRTEQRRLEKWNQQCQSPTGDQS